MFWNKELAADSGRCSGVILVSYLFSYDYISGFESFLGKILRNKDLGGKRSERKGGCALWSAGLPS